MEGGAAAAMQTILTMQGILNDFNTNFAFGSYLCPTDASTDSIALTNFDYIIVGGGSAGSVLTNRLSACDGVNVLLLEAGDCPPMEAILPGYMGLLPNTSTDYNTTGTNDNRTCQNLQGGVPLMTQGKMLSGSSGINHLIVGRGAPASIDRWAEETGDNSWSYNELLPYFKKSESVRNKAVMSQYGSFHGTSGPVIMTKQLSSNNDPIFAAYKELGLDFVADTSTNTTVNGVSNPLFIMGEKCKQNGVVSHISVAKDRPNLYSLTGATVSKVIFEDKVAVGVEYIYNDNTYTANASQEVILCAGALRTPQILIRSGVGPKEQVEKIGVELISELSVGQNFRDHFSSSMVIALQNDTAPYASASPFDFPIDTTMTYINLNGTNSSTAQCANVNLYMPHDSAGFMQLCLNLFKYTFEVCQIMYDANVGRSCLFIPIYLLDALSTGNVTCDSTDPTAQPVVNPGYFTDNRDLQVLAGCMSFTAGLVNTTTFKELGAEIVDFGFCSNYTKYSAEYWECETVAMSCNGWDYGGTAAMGSVVDTNLLVYGVSNLRVVDNSVMPSLPGSKPLAACLAIAEKASDLILGSNSKCEALVSS